MIQGLKVLDCSECQNLESIEIIQGLEKLYCADRPKLKHLPQIQGLKYLNCARTPVKSIPLINTLVYIFCEECRIMTHIPDTLIDKGNDIAIFNTCCPWINLSHRKFDKEHWLRVYQANIRDLETLQRWFRRVRVRKRLLRLIPQLIPLYYHPAAKGWYFHKKEMLQFIQTLPCNHVSMDHESLDHESLDQ
jgi:hypothetical protein